MLVAVVVFLVVLLYWGIWKLTVRLGWPGLVACAAVGFVTHLGGQEGLGSDYGTALLYAGLPLAVALLCGWRIAATDRDAPRWARVALLAMVGWWLFVGLAEAGESAYEVGQAVGEGGIPLLLMGAFEARLRHRERGPPA